MTPISRRQIAVVGSEDRDGLWALVRHIDVEIGEAIHPLSCVPLIHEGDDDDPLAWKVFTPERSDLAFIRDQRVTHRVWDCGVQEETLKAYVKAKGSPHFVSPMTCVEDGSRLRTLAYLPHRPALLPEADGVLVQLPDGDPVIRTWSDVVETLGPLRQHPDLVADDAYPPRFAREFEPSAERLLRLLRCEPPPWAGSVVLPLA